MTMTKVNGTAPTALAPAGQPDWLSAIRNAISSKVTPELIEKMVGAQIEKALAGDAKALKLVLDLASKMQAVPPQTVQATQNVFHVHLPAGEEGMAGDPLTLRVYAVLESMGPLSVGQIAANSGLSIDDVDHVLSQTARFEERGRLHRETLWGIKGGAKR